MNKIIKWAFLFLLIALPVSIYVFLQAFGENKFEIPIYFESGIPIQENVCSKGKGQHFVANFNLMDSSEQIIKDQVVIYNVGNVTESEEINKSNNLLMLQEAMDGWDNVLYQDFNLGTEEIVNFAKCDLNLNFVQIQNDKLVNDTVVLVDNKRRIRGYYSVLDRVEIDRLITEVNILLTE